MHFRRLRMEPLEDRRMLATFTVTNLLDGAVTAAGQLPGSLRQAIFDANALAGADEIIFENTTGTINLTAGEYVITQGLTITGPARDLLAIDAQKQSGIFYASLGESTDDFNISDLRLTNGKVELDFKAPRPYYAGAAILFSSSGMLRLSNCALEEHESYAGGGAIFCSGSLLVENCIISKNTITGTQGYSGGGIHVSGSTEIRSTTINDNHSFSHGGAIYCVGSLLVEDCQILRNACSDPSARGGGIYVQGASEIRSTSISDNLCRNHGGAIYVSWTDALIVDCLISNNSTYGGSGGGIFALVDLTIIQSTIAGNYTRGNNARGGGLKVWGDLKLLYSTLTDNRTLGPLSSGGGISFGRNELGFPASVLTMENSIVAKNDSNNGPDIGNFSPRPIVFRASYSLVGITQGLTEQEISDLGSNVLKNIDPLLTPLHSNGGNSFTYGLQPQSPAKNSGKPGLMAGVANVPLFDQRGEGYFRVSGGRIDMGAFEVQEAPLATADFDSDGDVDGRDFLAWQRGYGSTGSAATKARGNADFDADVDRADLVVWQTQYAGPTVASGDFDNDGDVDGRDFLAWQRNTSIGSLAIWQNQYSAAEELVVTLHSEDHVSALQLGATADLPRSAVSGLTFNSTAPRESNSSTPIFDEPDFTEAVIDAAFDDLAPTVSKVADFGDFVSTRHKAAKGTAL
jgi:predicted outer membrane repeat protein